MKKTALRYATIEVRPYPEVGEFLVVGILAVGQDGRVRGQVLPATKTGRLGNCFPEIDRAVFVRILQQTKSELQQLVKQYEAPLCESLLKETDWETIFHVLSQPRGGMLQIRRRGAAVTDDLPTWVKNAYERFVLRATLQAKLGGEPGLTKRVKALIHEWDLDTRYLMRKKVGNQSYHVQFPFVEMGRRFPGAEPEAGFFLPNRAIKPLHLGQDTPTKIQEHGDAWLMKVRRLEEKNLRPETLVFPLELPDGDGNDRADVAYSLREDFVREGVEIVGMEDEARLRNLLL